jgi:hypothetical protein
MRHDHGFERLHSVAGADAGGLALEAGKRRFGAPSSLVCGTTTDFNDDIVFSDGVGTQY